MILIAVFLLFLNYAVFFTIPDQFTTAASLTEMKRVLLNRKFFLLIIIILNFFFYKKYISENRTIRTNKKALIFSLIVSLNIFYIVELYFSFKTKSHGVGYTYAAKLWSIKYWNPINVNGFRDRTLEHTVKQKTIFFIGDSFTEGHGIENIEDRYSDIIRKNLPDYNVYNLGLNGIGTKKERDLLTLAPVKPDIVFWQYFSNDIDELLPEFGYQYSFTPYSDLNSINQKIVKGSFFINYLYWSMPHKDALSYLNELSKGIKNKELLKKHLLDCDSIINYCSGKNIKLVFIDFPLFIVDEKNIFNVHAQFMLEYMKTKSADIVDVNALTKDLTSEEKVVNNFDPHASVLVNKRIADYILKQIKL